MKTRYRKRTRFAVGACLALGLVSVHAATITETVPFTISAPGATNLPPQTVNVLTPQFNPALGTFQSGETDITGTTGIALEFFGTGAGGPYDFVVSDTLSLDGIPGRFDDEVTGIIPPNQNAFITPTATFPFGPVTRGDPAALVVGTGTWNQLFSLPYPSLSAKQGSTSVLAGIIVTGASVTTYNYTPTVAPVPEPCSLGVLAVVLGFGVAAANWRKRRLGSKLCRD